MSKPMIKRATISDDGLYRYSLDRVWWDEGGTLLNFVMLNPSTADADNDDPTIRRCMGFARRFGYSGIRVTNLYAYRATKPADLWRVADPVGPDNDRHLLKGAQDNSVVGAWGANAKSDRVAEVRSLLKWQIISALGLTKDGAPRHPLYLRGDAEVVSYKPWGDD